MHETAEFMELDREKLHVNEKKGASDDAVDEGPPLKSDL